MPQARGQDIGLDGADEDRVRRLLGDEPLEVAVARDPLRLDDVAGGEGGRADVADLALVHEVAERRQRLLDVRARIEAVHLVEVDPVGAQPPQRVLDRADDPAARVALLVGVLAHRVVELGGEDDVVAAAAGERLADDLLGLALPVDVGGVDEVDPGVERRVDDPDRLVVVRVAPRAEHHRAKTELADRHAGATQLAMLHRLPPFLAPGALADALPSDAKAAPRAELSASSSPAGTFAIA